MRPTKLRIQGRPGHEPQAGQAPDAKNMAVEFEQLIDAEGRLRLIPAAEVAALLARGITSVTSTISLIPAKPPREWLTIAEAGRAHVDDVDGLNVDSARQRVLRAIEAGKVRSEGASTRRRIDPDSLDVWRLAQREKNLRRCESEPDPEIVR